MVYNSILSFTKLWIICSHPSTIIHFIFLCNARISLYTQGQSFLFLWKRVLCLWWKYEYIWKLQNYLCKLTLDRWILRLMLSKHEAETSHTYTKDRKVSKPTSKMTLTLFSLDIYNCYLSRNGNSIWKSYSGCFNICRFN